MAAQVMTLLLVLRYGDHLEPCITEELAIACIKRHLPALPDAVWDEGDDGKPGTEYDVHVTPAGQVKLLALA